MLLVLFFRLEFTCFCSQPEYLVWAFFGQGIGDCVARFAIGKASATMIVLWAFAEFAAVKKVGLQQG